MSFKITGPSTAPKKLTMNSWSIKKAVNKIISVAVLPAAVSLGLPSRTAQAQLQEKPLTPAAFCRLNKSAYEQVNAARLYWLKVYDTFENQAHNEANVAVYGQKGENFRQFSGVNLYPQYFRLKKDIKLQLTLAHLKELKENGNTAAEKALNFWNSKDDIPFMNLFILNCNKAGDEMKYPSRYTGYYDDSWRF